MPPEPPARKEECSVCHARLCGRKTPCLEHKHKGRGKGGSGGASGSSFPPSALATTGQEYALATAILALLLEKCKIDECIACFSLCLQHGPPMPLPVFFRSQVRFFFVPFQKPSQIFLFPLRPDDNCDPIGGSPLSRRASCRTKAEAELYI